MHTEYEIFHSFDSSSLKENQVKIQQKTGKKSISKRRIGKSTENINIPLHKYTACIYSQYL